MTRTPLTPTYDATETGPRYWLTSRINEQTITFQQPLDDPFVSHQITIGWPELLRGLLRRQLKIWVQVGGDRDIVEDVLELNSDYLGLPNSPRRQAFNRDLHAAMGRHVDDEEARP